MTGGEPSSTHTAHTVEYDANKNAVDSVTVFQTNRAEIKRKIEVELKEGQNDVEVKNLPTCLEEDSIRVDGIGNATIFDVVYHPPPPIDTSKHEEALAHLNAREKEINAQLDILRQQADVLKEYSKTLKAADTDATKLEIFLDVYGVRQTKINDATKKLEDELKSIETQIAEKRKALYVDEESVRKRGTRVTIIVLADGEGQAELSLTYVVSNAWWRPLYDLRASVASDPKSQNSVGLHYRASISQKTGEDWNGVALTLSTASPLQGTKVPKLYPYWIGERKHASAATAREPSSLASSAAYAFPPLPSPPIFSALTDMPRMRHAEAKLPEGGNNEARPPAFFRSRDSKATAGAVSTVFAIPGLSTIPSDSDSAQQTHKVSIAELRFDSVDLEWVSVPKHIPSVFLRCGVKNTSNYVLLPGPANVFLNGSFVAKSTIPHVSQKECFSCSLGVDPAIRVTYHPRTTKARTTGGTLLSAKTRYSTSEQRITVKNTRLSSVPRLLVKEQVPISRDAKIKITILEPKGLAPGSQKSKETFLGEGTSVRWTGWKTDENGLSSTLTEELDLESAQGMLEWICNIKPSATVDLTLSWEVSAPNNVNWE